MKKKMKIWKPLSLFLTMILLFAGCGAADKMESAAPEFPQEDYREDVMVEEEAAVESESGVQAEELGDPNRKLIKRYYLNVETKEYDSLISYIETSVASAGGYIENSNLTGTSMDGYGNRYAYFVLRVPVKDAESFMDELQDQCHVTSRSEEVDDVTLAYVDTQSRIESLRLEQEALMEMLGEADNLETIIGLQSRLTEVRYEIESYESQIRSYDNLIEYTTITVDICEVKRESVTKEATFGERLSDNFTDGAEGLMEGLANFVIWFAGAIPTLLFLAVLGGSVTGVVLLCIKISKKKREKEMQAVMGIDISKDNKKED